MAAAEYWIITSDHPGIVAGSVGNQTDRLRCDVIRFGRIVRAWCERGARDGVVWHGTWR